MKCIGCGDTGSARYIQGYCLSCAAQRIRWYGELKKELDVAIEPVLHWYGEIERPAVHVVADIVRDLQKDRTQMLELRKANAQLKIELCAKRDMALKIINLEEQLKPPSSEELKQFTKKLKAFLVVGDAMDQAQGLDSHPLIKPLQEACTVIEKLNKAELQRVGELHEVYAEKATLKHNVHELRGELVQLVGWCEKRFGVSIVELLKTKEDLNTICEAVIKVVEEAW